MINIKKSEKMKYKAFSFLLYLDYSDVTTLLSNQYISSNNQKFINPKELIITYQ